MDMFVDIGRFCGIHTSVLESDVITIVADDWTILTVSLTSELLDVYICCISNLVIFETLENVVTLSFSTFSTSTYSHFLRVFTGHIYS